MATKEIYRSIRLSFKITEEDFIRLDSDFNIIHNFLGGKEPETRLEVWKAGLECVLERMAKSSSNKAKDAKKRAAILKQTRLIKERHEDWKSLESIYDDLTEDEFTAWCEENEIDLDAFLEWRESKQINSRGQELEKWLSDQLRSGEAIAANIIKQRAIEQGLISADNPKQWSYLRVIATRKGYSSGYGQWKNGVHAEKDEKIRTDDLF